MLSRTAADLYWMSRYLERAENMARMLDVSHSLALMPQGERGNGVEELAVPLLITGSMDAYIERHGELDAGRLVHFFALDGDNGASLLSCLRGARANAHAVRGRITADMWENINATWLEMRTIATKNLSIFGITRFCEWVKERAHLFRGATDGTLMRSSAYYFIQLGTYIERADNTLRLLDTRNQLMAEKVINQDSPALAYYQWTALLRALSAQEAYAAVYSGSPQADEVAELLLLRQDLPRSLRACIGEINRILAGMPGTNGRPAQRMAAELDARLRYTDINEILDEGLEEWISDYLGLLNELGNVIHTAYLEAA